MSNLFACEETMTPVELAEYLKVAKHAGVQSLTFRADGFDVSFFNPVDVLIPDARGPEDILPPQPTSIWPQRTDLPAPRVCACGHDLDIEHNECGCLHGCSHELCTTTSEEV